MLWFNKLFIQKLKIALDIPKINPIPRTGEDGEKVNCYSVYVTDKDGSYLADKVDGETLFVHKWNEEERTHNIPEKLNLNKIDELNFEINHYHGLITHNYKSPFEFVFYDSSGFFKLKSRYSLLKYTVPKFIHSKKRLKRPTRLKALEAVIKLTEDNYNKSFDCNRLLSEMYGSYTIIHPHYPTLKQGTHLVLMSLAESGELEQINSFEFRIKGKSLSSLEHLKEEVSKENRVRVQATAMLWLTVVLAIATAFQAGLVRTTFYSQIDWLLEPIFNYINSLSF
ncbi:hypothetical protein [Aliivibrio fischeri]|uniref:hypothetical protein n=1 Tax=Aliivibrio fischeri TaxID=668 RepID=UPI0012DAA8E7|nr:hypothetical protein [Aliivibrio fischeri]MUL16280.1 hypothetical protein [Aliivibrio fischeri]